MLSDCGGMRTSLQTISTPAWSGIMDIICFFSLFARFLSCSTKTTTSSTTTTTRENQGTLDFLLTTTTTQINYEFDLSWLRVPQLWIEQLAFLYKSVFF